MGSFSEIITKYAVMIPNCNNLAGGNLPVDWPISLDAAFGKLIKRMYLHCWVLDEQGGP